MLSKRLTRKWLAVMRDDLFRNRVFVHCSLSGKRRVGEVIDINFYTTLVKILQGAKSYIIIKRHNRNHNVQYFREEAKLTDEDTHTTA